MGLINIFNNIRNFASKGNFYFKKKTHTHNIMLKTFALIALIAVLARPTSARFAFGDCPESIPEMDSFDLQAYSGKWFEIARFSSWFQSAAQTDVTAEYEYINPNKVNVINSGWENGELTQVFGTAYSKADSAPNQLGLVFPTLIFGYPIYINEGNYNVWSVDYANYSVVYSCSSIIDGLLKSETAWILSRNTTLDSGTKDQLMSMLDQAGVDSSAFMFTNHTMMPMQWEIEEM